MRTTKHRWTAADSSGCRPKFESVNIISQSPPPPFTTNIYVCGSSAFVITKQANGWRMRRERIRFSTYWLFSDDVLRVRVGCFLRLDEVMQSSTTQRSIYGVFGVFLAFFPPRRAGTLIHVYPPVFRIEYHARHVRFLRSRKFFIHVVGGRAASWWPFDFLLRVSQPYIS